GLGTGAAPDLLAALAPVAGVSAGAVLMVRLAAPVAGALLGRATRSRRAVPVLAAARARSGHTTLALLATTVAAGLVTVTAVVGATVHAGQDAGSWDAVGADVAVEVPEPEPGLRVLAEGLERHDGVTT